MCPSEISLLSTNWVDDISSICCVTLAQFKLINFTSLAEDLVSSASRLARTPKYPAQFCSRPMIDSSANFSFDGKVGRRLTGLGHGWCQSK